MKILFTALLVLYSCMSRAQVTYEDALASLARGVAERLVGTPADNVLVGSFKRIDGNACELGSTLTLDLEAALVNTPKEFRLLDRQNLQAMAEEHKLEMNGMMDEEQIMREAGKLLKADAMIFGYYTLTNDQLVLRVKAVDVQTSEQLTVLTANCIPAKIIKDLCANTPTAARPVESVTRSVEPFKRPTEPVQPPCADRTIGSYCMQNNGKVDLSLQAKFPVPYNPPRLEALVVRPGRTECFNDKPVGAYDYTLYEVYPRNPVYPVKNTERVAQGSIRIEGCATGRMTYP